jgi:hypothetical protein
MKIKIRPHDPEMLQEPDWRQMNGWLAEIREHDHARSASDDASDDDARPAPGGDPRPEALAEPEALTEPDATAEPEALTEPDATAEPEALAEPGATAEPARAEAADQTADTARAVIGDELRVPIMWCEMGSCISWCADSSALGEADLRARAISAGWRVDALGRLACPRCQQTDPWFWATSPVVLWDRYTAVARAAAACGEGILGQLASPYPGRWS